MKASTIKYGVLTGTLTLISIILVLLPFHAFLSVWAASLFGHYTAMRLWKELLIVGVGLGVLYLLFFDRKVRFHTLSRKLTWLIVAYVVLQVLTGIVSWRSEDVTLKAMLYGVLLNCRYLVFFLLAWVVAVRTERFERRWPKLMLWPAVVVVVFGLMQVFLLPINFLSHFGYTAATIAPYETINHNIEYIRYMSTLRGANPLGAYLLLPISALVVLLVRYPRSWNWTKGLLLAGALAMLFFSFSRSAWLGAVLSTLTVVIAASKPEWWRKTWKWWAGGAAMLVGVALIGVALLHNNMHFQNFIFHTQDNSAVASSSNDGHAAALEQGVRDIAHHPLGSGPGTAGPASIYNNHARIAENYFLQIGQEVGVLGVALLVAITATIAWLLWTRRQAPLALTLLAALVGLTFVNLLSHAWTDDTIAYIWWGFAGLAIATPVVKKGK